MKKREKRINKLKEKLIAQKQQLLSEAGMTITTMPENNLSPDLGDQASTEIDRNFILRLREREQKLLRKIDLALERMEEGKFGICENCGSKIETERLEARPVTTMCIDCKTLQEEEEERLKSNY